MKKVQLFVFAVLTCLSVFAQRGKYKYNYELQPSYDGEKSSYTFISSEKNKQTALKLNILDYNGDSLLFAAVKISNAGTVVNAFSSFSNPLSIELDSGSFEVEIHYPERKPLRFSLSLIKNNISTYSVKMGREKSLDIYEVHSKRKLNKVKLNEILKCIESDKEFNACGVKDEYYIAMQI